jgi:alpha-N-arabinofuranosidase
MDAGELVDYCNTPGGTYWSELRRTHGIEKPHDVRLWCLGNEMDGEWQIAALKSDEYARKAKESAKIMRWMDPRIKLIACGTCTNEIDHKTFGEWDRIVTEETYDYIDYISLHRYFNYRPEKHMFYPMYDDITDIPFFFRDLQDFLDTVIAACDFVKGKNRKDKSIMISFDEYGVVTEAGAIPGGKEQNYGFANFSLLDAVIYGGILCTFINNADRVNAACQSLLVNEGGFISTAPGGNAIRQAPFYVLKDVTHGARGNALRPLMELPLADTRHHGKQQTMTAAGTFDGKKLRVFIMNCDLKEDCDLTLRFGSFEDLKPVSHTVLFNEDYRLSNTFECENRIQPQTLDIPRFQGGALRLTIQKHSWHVLEFDAVS